MDIRSIDLNLLVVFNAMAEQRNVTRGAEAIGLSQPAMSAAVARLRKLFNDPLFVRSGSEMKMTPLAEELTGPIRRVIDTVKDEVLQKSAFDPATTQRCFTIITPDIGEVKIVPRLLGKFSELAPNAKLKMLSMPPSAAGAALESGEAELAVGYFPDLHATGFFQQKLFRNSHVCIVRKDHPEIGEAMTLKQFVSASHAVVRPDGREHVFEQFLRTRLSRPVLVEVAHFMSLLPIIATSDLVATVPVDIANVCVRYGPIRQVDPPIRTPVIDVHQFWHRRLHKDAGNIWLRKLVHELCNE